MKCNVCVLQLAKPQWAELGYEVLVANLKDHSYGHVAEAIKHSIGTNSQSILGEDLSPVHLLAGPYFEGVGGGASRQ